MAINFDALPQDKPQGDFALFEKGIYNAEVIKAEMATAKKTGARYLSTQLKLTDDAGNTALVFDSLFDNDKPLVRYKLGQFLRALDMGLSGSFELADLVKIIINRKFRVAIKTEKNGDYPERNVVDAYDDGIYYKFEDLPWKQEADVNQSPIPDTAEEGPIY